MRGHPTASVKVDKIFYLPARRSILTFVAQNDKNFDQLVEVFVVLRNSILFPKKSILARLLNLFYSFCLGNLREAKGE